MVSIPDTGGSVNFLQGLEDAYTASDRLAFEKILYERIREVALAVCQPKVATAEEATSLSRSTNETSSDAELLEYNTLLNSLFSDFEAFLARANCEKPTKAAASATATVTTTNVAVANVIPKQAHADALAALNAHLTAVCPKVRTPCGRVFKALEPTFRCKDCSTDPTCAFCRTCFFASIHATHKYKMHASGGGYCDCGDEEAWTSGAWCRIHGGEEETEAEMKEPTSSSSDNSGHQAFRSVDDEQRQEMERLQQRLDALPLDAVKRCSYLLRPLINSAAFVLFELIQGSPRPACLTPLSRQSTAAASTDVPPEEDPDCAEAVDAWPPPLSHLPFSSWAEDARELGVSGWPRTAPPNRDSLDVEMRCRAQQSRAHRFHPLLFAAPNKDLFAAHFSAILYNNEFHNYDEVIKVVRRYLGCTDQQATLFAILVNRDGRTPVITSAVRRSASKLCADISSAESRASPRPLHTIAVDSNIYAVEQFCICVLRWLERVASAVRPLRPLICSALLGRHVTFAASGAVASGGAASAATVLPPGEMLVERSLLALLLERFHSTHRGVRKVVSHLIVAVLLQEAFHRRVFAIEFTRHFDSICQAYVYDDHLDADSLFSLTCQFYTVTSLARQLLQQNNAALRVISRLCRAIAANSQPLHAFYEVSQSRNRVADLFNPDCTFRHFPSALQSRLQTLRAANRVAWRRAHEYTRLPAESDVAGAVVEQSRYPPSVFVWLHAMEPRPEFSPFQRMLRVTSEVRYLLVSLLNMKPLAGETEECPEGWWDVGSRENFLAYFHRFLELLSYLQDMNAMQRAIDVHVETEQEWISSFNMISYLFTIISLTVQVASTDRTLLLSAIKEARDAFEDRVGVIDRCFRVKPFTRTQTDRAADRDDSGIENLTFQTLGATSEVYEYDVATMKFSIVQTLPRLLAALYGHGIEMGLSPTRLGLADEGFANLVIERPLQTIAFCAQCSANLWVRNGLVIQNIMQNMFNNLRVEMVDRNFQLIQQAAAVLSPDELIVRMVHKLNLRDYLSETPSQPKQGRVQAMESLLRVIHFIVTSRSRYAVGHFDPAVVAALPTSPQLFPTVSNDLDEALEINYGLLVDDVIHQLCIRPMTHSELLSALPFQPAGCLLRKAPPYTSTQGEAASKGIIDREAATCSWRGSRKDSVERPLARILQQVATQTMVGSKQKFALRPEVIATRFDRFYPTYRHSDQTHVEELVTRTLKKTLESSPNLLPADFPIPPPPPRPRRRFANHLNGPILGLLRCTTFVRLLRQLLDIGIKQGNLQSKWSETLFELILHLISIALYEDSIAFAETGEKPFLKAVSQVPEEAESEEELERLAVFQHWKRRDQSGDVSPTNYNCLLPRLKILVGLPDHERQADLTKWVIKLWKEVAEGQSAMSPLQSPSMDVDEESPALEKQRRLEAKRQRQANILAKMSNMQRKFIATHAQFEGLADEEEEDADAVGDRAKQAEATQDLTHDPNDLSAIAALGPNPHRDRMKELEKEPASVTCILCLEEMPENAERGLVVAAFASRTNVLSTPLPCKRAVTFSESDNSTSSRAITIDSASGKPAWIDRNLAAIATTAVAASVGSGETVLSQLPRLLLDLPSCAAGETKGESSELPSATGVSSSSTQMDCTNGQKIDEAGTTTAADAGELDPCFPRPLVASRDPIGEEGTFIAFCPHAMHAACKEKYARQLKNRSDQIGRRLGNRAPIYEFRCSVCKALSNFDLPLYGRVTDGLSRVWLSRQLAVSQNSYDLAAWLRRIQHWLDARPPSAAPGSATDRQRKDFPASLEQLYRLIHPTWSNEGDILLAANQEPISSARLTQLRALMTETYWKCRHSFPESEANDSESVATSTTESSEMSDSVEVRRSRSILGQARCLLRRCFRRVSATAGGASTEASGEPPVSPSAMVAPGHGGGSSENPHVLLEPPIQPPRVSTSLRVLVQRLAMLSQPCRLETLQRLSRRSAAHVFFNFPIQTPHNPEELLELIMETFNPAEETLLETPIPATAQATIHQGGAAAAAATPSTHRLARQSTVGSTSGGSGRSTIPPPLSETVDELHLSLRSSYARLLAFAEFVSPSEEEGDEEEGAAEVADPVSLISSVQIDRFYQAATHLRAAVECTRRRGLRAVWSAACEWRAVRHSVAYTLVVWERHMRQMSPTSNFFNDELADRYKKGLSYLLRATLKAHAQLAPVSRGCPLTCKKMRDENGQCNHVDCWPQHRDDPVWWWWWSYFSPDAPDTIAADCCSEDTRKASNLVEAITRVAVTEDAARLWRLLLPDCRALTASAHSDPTEVESAMVMGDGTPLLGSSVSASAAQDGTDLSSEKSPASLNLPISILWEADITFLFVNLIFLRPGLEEASTAVECQRTQSLRAIKKLEAERDSTAAETEGLRQSELPLLAACDEGFPRVPIGDSHEAFLLRLCYTALLVQALLSWQPDPQPDDHSQQQQQQPNRSGTDPYLTAWRTEKLLVVRRRLQQLCGLPVHTSVPASPTASRKREEDTAALRSLFEHIRATSLPFLRIAAFIVQQITNVDFPTNLSQQEQESLGKPVDEFILLLAYLGLPLGPTDLLVMLSDEVSQQQPAATLSASETADGLSSSLWLARLITSWCLVGRSSVSRRLYAKLRAQFLPQLTASAATPPGLLPQPQIRVPRLIHLPQEYVSLLAMTTELKSVHTGSNIHSDPSLCLSCGAVACFACYSCRTFEHYDRDRVGADTGGSATYRRGYPVYDMQAHVRRNHSGYAMILLLQSGHLLLLSDQARRTTELTEPYRDEFGETDVDLRRGNPLFLDEPSYRNLNEIWLKHQTAHATASDLYLL